MVIAIMPPSLEFCRFIGVKPGRNGESGGSDSLGGGFAAGWAFGGERREPGATDYIYRLGRMPDPQTTPISPGGHATGAALAGSGGRP
jgi:hypothetical protein